MPDAFSSASRYRRAARRPAAPCFVFGRKTTSISKWRWQSWNWTRPSATTIFPADWHCRNPLALDHNSEPLFLLLFDTGAALELELAYLNLYFG